MERLPNGEYLPIDIKSGMGLEGDDDENEGKLKKTYALQLALYVDTLRRLGLASHFLGKIWDSEGAMVDYALDAPRGARNPQTWWEWYGETADEVRAILAGRLRTEASAFQILTFPNVLPVDSDEQPGHAEHVPRPIYGRDGKGACFYRAWRTNLTRQRR